MIRKSVLFSLFVMLLPMAALCADSDSDAKVSVKLDSRVDYFVQSTDDNSTETTQSGFSGKYLNLKVDADINSQISVHLRQRLNKFKALENNVFGATDWVYIDYSPCAELTLSGGKQVVAIGGYEYDRNPIDIYFASMFWNNIGCYQFGVSATYHTPDGNHNILAQISNSPYTEVIGDRRYAYNLMWMGNMGCYETLWSANLVEYDHGRYGSIISLGNKLTFNKFYAEIDLMNRHLGHQDRFFDDYSIIGKMCASVGKFDLFAKGGYERYRTVPGQQHFTEKPFYGIGVEFFPLKGNRDLRLHLCGSVTHDAFSGDEYTRLDCGVMWRVNIFNK